MKKEDSIEDEYKNRLFQDLVNGHLSNFDNETLAKIKEMVFLSYWNEKDKDKEDFIKSRRCLLMKVWK